MSVPEAADAREIVGELPAFAIPPDEVRILVAESFEPVSFPFGGVIVREGDEADAFFVLAAGSARVVKLGEHGDEVPLNVLRRGDSFGEMALLGDTVRTATVRASSPVQALRLGKSSRRSRARTLRSATPSRRSRPRAHCGTSSAFTRALRSSRTKRSRCSSRSSNESTSQPARPSCAKATLRARCT